MFNACTRKADARLLIERQPFSLRPIRQRLPFLLREKNQPEVPRVNTFLFRGLIRYDMRDELMTGQTERNGLFRSTSDSAAEAIDIEPKRDFNVVDRKGEMENSWGHV